MAWSDDPKKWAMQPGTMVALWDGRPPLSCDAIREIIEAAEAVSATWDCANQVVMLRSRVKDGVVDRGEAFDRLQIALRPLARREDPTG